LLKRRASSPKIGVRNLPLDWLRVVRAGTIDVPRFKTGPIDWSAEAMTYQKLEKR